jgi:hypothetical protein
VHELDTLDAVIGSVVPGSARIENGRGIALVRISERADVEPIWRDIQAGHIRAVSIGYQVHRFEVSKPEAGPPSPRSTASPPTPRRGRPHALEPSEPRARAARQAEDPTFADAILDRLVHNAHRLELAGESMRKLKAARKRLDPEPQT